MEKIYHIYAGEKCLFHSIKEEDFQVTWRTLNQLVGLMHTDYDLNDLAYEELYVNKEAILNSSH